MSRATLDKRPEDVSRMFDAVAHRYDLMNVVMTFGQERRWRRVVRQLVAPGAGVRILDVAAGTGASTQSFADAGAVAVACDFSAGMLHEGRRRHPGLTFVAGDALLLPFGDEAFDVVTVSFGLRNVASLDRALSELARVTKPGGRLVVLETATPRARSLRAANRVYTDRVMPVLARLLASDSSSYSYLAESASVWLTQPMLAERMRAGGWHEVVWRDLMFGAVAVHRAVKPAPPG